MYHPPVRPSDLVIENWVPLAASAGAVLVLLGYLAVRRRRSARPPFAQPMPSAPAQQPSVAAAPPPRPWAAEETVDPAQARALIEAQFPALAPVRLEPLGVGWDNTAYLVNDELVFRFPRREIAAPLLAVETRLLPAIAAQLPLPVPLPIFHGRPSSDFRWAWSGYRHLPGRTACRAHLDDKQREAAALPLGRFLAALHALPVDEMVALGAGGDSIGRLDLSVRVPRALEMLSALPPAALGVDPGAVRTSIEACARLRPPPARALVHGDLYVRHLLVDDQAALCGVIDWGDLHIGHPAIDLAVAYGFLPPAARPTFLRAYGKRVPAPTWWLARFRAVYSALCILSYSRDVGDGDLEGEGRQSLANALAGA
jgi:aminoglycoside phosphotransferase (APT) family kinase protein